MKKVFNTLSALLFVQLLAHAQQPANRTTATKIADVLAQQPAEEEAKFASAMHELESFTSEDITQLLLGLRSKGASRSGIEYAANSYGFYVLQANKESLRLKFSNGLVGALEQLTDKQDKGFVLQLIKQVSKNEAIPAVVPYLKDTELLDKAAMALNGIRTEEAAQALATALQGATTEQEVVALVAALGDLKAKDQEEAIIALLQKYPSENFQRNAYTALSKIAGAKSAPYFLEKLKAVNYQFDKSNVGGLTLAYAANLAETNNQKLALSVINQVMKGAVNANAITLQAGALDLLTAIDSRKAKKQLMKGALSANAQYRATALRLLREQATAAETTKLIKALKGASPAVQESIFNYLAVKAAAADTTLIKTQLASVNDPQAKIAGLRAWSTIAKGSNSSGLIQAIDGANTEVLKGIVDLLLSSKDTHTITQVNAALAGADSKTQLALLNVLGTRMDDASSKAVIPLLSTNDAAVKSAALQVLPNVATAADVPTLVDLLAKSNAADAPQLQWALVNALNDTDNKDQQITELVAAIARYEAAVAANFFPVLAGLGGNEALDAVNGYLANAAVRDAAIKSLANWSNPEALSILIGLSRTEKGTNFDVVFSGLIKQINSSEETAEQKTLYLKDAFALAQNAAQKRTVLASLQATETYQALIFAGKFLDDNELKRAATGTAMNIAMDNKAYIGADVRAILEKAMANLSGSESSYLREAIVRHLAEMPKGEGYVSIFNGVNLTGWKGLVDDPIKRAKLSEKALADKQRVADQEMRANWKVENGDLVFTGHGDNIATIKQYGDFEMLVDWKLDPNGKEPDAGVYLRGTPQVQIWDISRTNVGAQVGSGGLYNNQKHAKDPLKVADNALGEWNTFKIRMVGEQVSVWLNGELVVDNVVLENYWDRNQSIFPTEQIELQAHGSRVWYREIYVKELARKEVTRLTAAEKSEGFDLLFDGTNLDKWTATSAYEINPEGYIRANPDAKFGKNLYTKEQYADFVYRFDFKLTPGANNGVGIRTPLEGDAAYAGTEIQILDNDADIYKNLHDYQYHGSAYGIIPAKRAAMKPMGEWNSQEIWLKGSKIKVTLNGVVILDGDLAAASKNGTLDKKEHPGLRNSTGHIGFLGHGTEVFFRNIRVKRL